MGMEGGGKICALGKCTLIPHSKRHQIHSFCNTSSGKESIGKFKLVLLARVKGCWLLTIAL